MVEGKQLPTLQTRLAAVEAELTELQSAYELAMSSFRFDEASGLQRRIATLEGQRRALAAALPPSSRAEPPTGIVPTLARPRRRR